MIPVADVGVFEAGRAELAAFGSSTGARGRFIAIYLGFRLMGDRVAPLGSNEYTSSTEIQSFLDRMWTKVHRPEPLTVLTAPFGGGGANGGYSTVTGGFAPGNGTATNTWRNNLNSQKGVGCAGDPALVAELVTREDPRAACPHLQHNGTQFVCGITGAAYRNEQHAIWLSKPPAAPGFQVVDLNEQSAYESYLRPSGERIPLLPLLAVLYGFAPSEVYPERASVSAIEFAADFGFEPSEVRLLFDTDPTSPANARMLRLIEFAPSGASLEPPAPPTESTAPPTTLPTVGEAVLLNDGLVAELAVAHDLSENGWAVTYTGNQPLLGYDLRATRGDETLMVEVKSSVGYVTPKLTSSEWAAANAFGPSFLLALVDFVGSTRRSIRYVADPASQVEPVIVTTLAYRLGRAEIDGLPPAEIGPA